MHSCQDELQGSERALHHRGDVFTPNSLLICQQDVSTILGGDIKPAKTHLYADNMLLYAAALIKPLTASQAPRLSLLQLMTFLYTLSIFQHHVCVHKAAEH